MIIFAFCTFGLIFALIKYGIGKMNSNLNQKEFEQKYSEKKSFMESIKASPDEIERASDVSNLDDVLDDLSYILGREVKKLDHYYNVNTGAEFLKTALRIKDLVICIRLARIGKANTDKIMYTSGILTSINSDYYNQVHRFYEVLANHFINSGIDMYVYEDDTFGTQLTNLNLSKFETYH